MKISDELREKIETAFKNNIDIKNKLLSCDIDTIREIGHKSQTSISPEEVILSYENNAMDYLYKKAKRLKEMNEIYKELCIEVSKDCIGEREK